MSTIRCPHCGTANRAGSNFCNRCGTDLRTDDATEEIDATAAETEELTRRAGDPLISRVAAKLVAQAAGAGPEAGIARVALRELYAACHTR